MTVTCESPISSIRDLVRRERWAKNVEWHASDLESRSMYDDDGVICKVRYWAEIRPPKFDMLDWLMSAFK